MNHWWRKVKTNWQRLPIARRGSIVIAIPLVCLMGSAITDLILHQKIIAAQIQVTHTNTVLAKSQNTLISLLNAETGLRGYYIGRQKVFLEPYDRAVTTLAPSLLNLEQLVRDRPVQVQQVKLLTRIASYKMLQLQNVIEQINTKEVVSSEVTTQSLLEGKRTMDRFRAVMEQFQAEERYQLELGIRSLQTQQQLNDIIMWVGVAIGIFTTTLALRLLRKLADELLGRELSLRNSRNSIETIVANVVDGVMTIDPHGKVTTFNHAAVKMFGYTPTEAIGCDWQKLLIERDDLTQKLNIRIPGTADELIPTGKIWQAIGQRNNGEWFPIEVSINSIAFDRDSTRCERIAIVRDTTERQQAKAKLQAKANELIALNASLTASNDSLIQSNHDLEQQRAQIQIQNLQREDFIAHLTHDLRTPLVAANLMFDLFVREAFCPLSPEMHEAVAAMNRSNQNLLDLVNTLLEVHHYESGTKTLTLTTCNMWEIVRDVVQELQPLAEYKSIELIALSDIPNPDKLEVLGDRQELRRMTANLVGNALKFTESGKIELRLGFCPANIEDKSDLRGWVSIDVRDTGLGMSVDEQKVIFQRFHTGHHRQAGSGLGLHLVHRIVTTHSGTISVTSGLGRGSLFKIRLPIDKPSLPLRLTAPLR